MSQTYKVNFLWQSFVFNENVVNFVLNADMLYHDYAKDIVLIFSVPNENVSAELSIQTIEIKHWCVCVCVCHGVGVTVCTCVYVHG